MLHTCFGYAHIVHDRPTGYPFLRELDECVATHISLEAAQPGLDPRCCRDLPGKTIVLGVLDLGSTRSRRRRSSPTGSARALEVVPPERLVVAPDCGMKYLPRELAFRKLEAMVAGARLVREDLASERGRTEPPVSRISQAYPDRVEVRGRDLTGDLMGGVTSRSTSTCCSPATSRPATSASSSTCCSSSIAEHGMMPTNVAARMTLAADPGSLQGAVAAGILGAGPVVLGTSEECARLLEGAGEVAAGGVRGRRRGGRRRDPRSRRQGARLRPPGAHARSTRAPSGSSSSRTPAASAGRTSCSPACLRDAVAEAWGRPLTMNVSMPIAAVLLDLGFPAAAVKAVPILARTAGLLAHLAEEQERPLGFLLARGRRGGGRVRAPTE